MAVACLKKSILNLRRAWRADITSTSKKYQIGRGKMASPKPGEGYGYPIRVFLINDEALIRAGMRMLIDSWLVSKVVGEAADTSEAIAALKALEADVLVVSHNGRSLESLRYVTDFIQAVSSLPLVLLTTSGDPTLAAVATGARWVVPKHCDGMDLRLAIEKAYCGESSFAVTDISDSNGRDGNEHLRIEPDVDGTLTHREREVVVLISEGCTNRQVAARLGITPTTVGHHMSSIFSKLRIANRFELIAWAYRRRLVNFGNMAL
jgi:DNA-binding NarL/FixJ family response regulator